MNIYEFIEMLSSKTTKDGHTYVTLYNLYSDKFDELCKYVDTIEKLKSIDNDSKETLTSIIYKLKNKPREFFRENEFNDCMEYLEKVNEALGDLYD